MGNLEDCGRKLEYVKETYTCTGIQNWNFLQCDWLRHINIQPHIWSHLSHIILNRRRKNWIKKNCRGFWQRTENGLLWCNLKKRFFWTQWLLFTVDGKKNEREVRERYSANVPGQESNPAWLLWGLRPLNMGVPILSTAPPLIGTCSQINVEMVYQTG